MKTAPWWVCNICHKPIVRVGKKGLLDLMGEHRKKHPIATCSIKQLPQKGPPK